METKMNFCDFEKIATLIDHDLIVYQDEDFVYLLCTEPFRNGNIVFQLTEKLLILWSNDYKSKSSKEVFEIVLRNVTTDVLFPQVETAEERIALNELGAHNLLNNNKQCSFLYRYNRNKEG